MPMKIQLTITPNTEVLDPTRIDAAMARTIGTLQRLGIVPLRKIVLNVECQDEIAGELEDTIDAALSARPVGIKVVMEKKSKRHVSRDTLAPVTPMDEALRVSEVTLSSGERSVTMTSETARNAVRMARNAVVGSDRELRQ